MEADAICGPGSSSPSRRSTTPAGSTGVRLSFCFAIPPALRRRPRPRSLTSPPRGRSPSSASITALSRTPRLARGRRAAPFVCSSAVVDGLVDSPTDIVARVAPAQSYCWPVYADYLVSAGHRHVAVIVQPDRYWSSGARLLQTSLSERGVAVTEIDHATLAETPLADAVAAADGVDALLLLVAYPEPAASLVKAVRAETRLAGLRSEIRRAAQSSRSGWRSSAKTAPTFPSCGTCPPSSDPWERRSPSV